MITQSLNHSNTQRTCEFAFGGTQTWQNLGTKVTFLEDFFSCLLFSKGEGFSDVSGRNFSFLQSLVLWRVLFAA
jgi:hypothetical protein